MAIGDGQVVEFTKEAVRAYLDEAIRFFREQRDDQGSTTAVFYIDAYQKHTGIAVRRALRRGGG